MRRALSFRSCAWLALLQLFLLGCSLRWSTHSTEEVRLGNRTVLTVARTTRFWQGGSDRNLGMGRDGTARGWAISFTPPGQPTREVDWEAEDRVPILLDLDAQTGRFFIVAVKPFSNGTLGDNHWPSGRQNPYYVYVLEGQAWKEIEFPPGLVGRRNNLLVRFEHFYVPQPTPDHIGHMSLAEKARLELAQDAEMKKHEDYRYKYQYRVIGDPWEQSLPLPHPAPSPD